MVAGRYLRLSLFCLGSGALLVVGVSLMAEEGASSAGTAVRGPSVPAVVGPQFGHLRQERQLRGDARRFLRAFFQYEEGELSHSVRPALRAGATEEFGAELLRAPPRLHGGLPAARIARLYIKEASWRPAIAVVGGVARRGGRSERFSFLFASPAGRWLAGGPAP